jgi:regulator of replication initiation timing
MPDDKINEKDIHEKIAALENQIRSLKSSLQRIKLQLNYTDDMIQDAKLQRESKPLIIKRE